MKSGKLRHRIIIEQATLGRSATGEVTKTWATFATLWSERRDGKSREFLAAQAVQSEVHTLFVTRYFAGVTNLMRVNFEGVLYDIHAVTDPDDRKREMHLQCLRA
jgi:SPP1 family predicted phage head-tail adaptor